MGFFFLADIKGVILHVCFKKIDIIPLIEGSTKPNMRLIPVSLKLWIFYRSKFFYFRGENNGAVSAADTQLVKGESCRVTNNKSQSQEDMTV